MATREKYVEIADMDVRRVERVVEGTTEGETTTEVSYEPNIQLRAVIKEDGKTLWDERLNLRQAYQILGNYQDQREILEMTEAELQDLFAVWLDKCEQALDTRLADQKYQEAEDVLEAFAAKFGMEGKISIS